MQLFLGSAACIMLFWVGVRSIKKKELFLRKDFLPFAVFMLVLLISSLLSFEKADALITWTFFFLASIFFWTFVLSSPSEATILLLTRCLLTGISLACLLHILSFFSLLPFEKFFTPLGTLIDHAVIVICILPVVIQLVRTSTGKRFTLYSLRFTLILLLSASVFLAIYELIFIAKPALLPGFMALQIALSELLHDSARIPVSFFFGSGPGTFITDFTRFKPASINFDSDLWAGTFSNSSSFLLELLATTGTIGTLAYLWIGLWLVRMILSSQKNMFAWACFLIFVGSLVLPLSYTSLAVFCIVAGFAVLSNRNREAVKSNSLLLPANIRLPVSLLCILCSLFFAFFLIRFAWADMLFTQSLESARKNNGAATYQKQKQAIMLFPYRDSFYRSFSQTSLSLGNALLARQGSSQQDGLLLIQQSITLAKTATMLAPLTAVNWQNLAAIYRSLTVIGNNAQSFAITSMQQALLLDPNNPQEYINLGGIYYQLGQWDDALREFSSALDLKPDFANAYYNRGHTYEQKGDSTNALKDYQKVSNLLLGDPQRKAEIDAEIQRFKKKIGKET